MRCSSAAGNNFGLAYSACVGNERKCLISINFRVGAKVRVPLAVLRKVLNSLQVCERSWRGGDDNPRSSYAVDPRPDMQSAEFLIVAPSADLGHDVSSGALSFGPPTA
jgi:hypothetical protein